MAIPIPSPLVDFILLGPTDDRRQLQDSPILGDVWIEYARAPNARLDLLMTPLHTQPAGVVAEAITVGLQRDYGKTHGLDVSDEAAVSDEHVAKLAALDEAAYIAYLQGIVVAHLLFTEVLRVVVPLTKWWNDKWRTEGRPHDWKPQSLADHQVSRYTRESVTRTIEQILTSAEAWNEKKPIIPTPDVSPLDRYIVLTGLILWAANQDAPERNVSATSDVLIREILGQVAKAPALIEAPLTENLPKIQAIPETPPAKAGVPLIWQVSLNRTATAALTKSVPAVKADAAKTLFTVNCAEIGWAVIDSGVDGTHPAFKTPDGSASRIKKCYDFTAFRQIVTLSNSNPAVRRKNLDLLLQRQGLLRKPDDPARDLKQLADDVKRRRPIHWELVEPFVELSPGTKPFSNHGTHVAGIIGASKEAANRDAKEAGQNHGGDDRGDGMCPDIQLYDFRVLGPTIRDTEFAIIAALQFIRHLNDRDNFFTIHGANLSLSIPHDIRNFACGRTPICNEGERLIDSGVVVVAAAGNHGYKSFQTQEGAYESYAAFSITDPGNAEGLITVGATHRYWPHTYGVSFFSSRGPTGDGRLKPDLVAPGERIRAPFWTGGKQIPGGEWGDLDGTSMAAPHVSGAAAMLMARYSELIGQPRRVKHILCKSATDLGRERSFQGHGMLDVLRAFQSI